jgi:hypothetical protein
MTQKAMIKDALTERQKLIFDSLSTISQEIAGFYKAGLHIYSGDCPNEAYFLVHAAREIDGGLRDVLAVDYSSEDNEQDRQKKSILFFLSMADLEGLAKDWFKASNELHSYAYRHGGWKSPCQIEEVKPIWDRFKNILECLVGSYYAVIERIGRISNLQGSFIDTLSNILTIPTYYNYFFGNEKDVKYLKPLQEKGFFSPDQIKFDEQNDTFFRNALDYLDHHHNTASFIECLTKFEDEASVKLIGKMFLKMLENTTLTFRQESIELIVLRIYKKGNRNDADTICNTYGRCGIHFFKPVWEEHQKSRLTVR